MEGKSNQQTETSQIDGKSYWVGPFNDVVATIFHNLVMGRLDCGVGFAPVKNRWPFDFHPVPLLVGNINLKPSNFTLRSIKLLLNE